MEDECNNESGQIDKRKVSNQKIEPCSGDIIEENPSNPTFNKNGQLSENSELAVSRHSVEGKNSFSVILINHNSVNLSDPQTIANPQYDFEFDLSENNEIIVSPFTFSFRKQRNSSYCQRLRKWLKQRKFTAFRFLAACCPCLKNSSTVE